MKRLLVILAVLALLPAANASAGVITFTSGAGNPTLTITTAGSLNLYNGGAIVGVEYMTVTNATGLAPLQLGGTYAGYCVDLMHYMSDGTAFSGQMSTWNLNLNGGTSDSDRGRQAAWLYNTYAAGRTGNASAALQLAIWEVLFETATPRDAGAGNVQFSGDTAVVAAANTLLSGLTTTNWLNSDAIWVEFTDTPGTPYAQDYITNVPEPGSMLLLGTGLVGLAGGLRRRLRRK